MTFLLYVILALHLITIIMVWCVCLKKKKEYNAYLQLDNDDLRAAIVNMIVEGGGIDNLRIAIEEKERRKAEKKSGSMAAVIEESREWRKRREEALKKQRNQAELLSLREENKRIRAENTFLRDAKIDTKTEIDEQTKEQG